MRHLVSRSAPFLSSNHAVRGTLSKLHTATNKGVSLCTSLSVPWAPQKRSAAQHLLFLDVQTTTDDPPQLLSLDTVLYVIDEGTAHEGGRGWRHVIFQKRLLFTGYAKNGPHVSYMCVRMCGRCTKKES